MNNQELSTKNAPQELSPSQRFTAKVLALFTSNVGEIAASEYQRRLIQGYFVAIDAMLKKTEEKRLKTTYKQEPLPYTWQNVNMDDLATMSVHLARIGLDSNQKNHINFIPYKNGTTMKYDIGCIKGYVGIEYEAKRYALEMPVDVIVELVYTTDTFRPIKRNLQNKYESYEFELGDPFARGDIKGGFAYFIYENPTKNKLMVMSLADILKRKPKYASAEFWGGEKDIWENNKKTGAKETIDGWYEEMCLKTVKRAAYGSIPLDPQKIDDTYQWLKARDSQFADREIDAEIEKEANKAPLFVENEIIQNESFVDCETGEIIEEAPEVDEKETTVITEEPQEQKEPEQKPVEISGAGGTVRMGF